MIRLSRKVSSGSQASARPSKESSGAPKSQNDRAVSSSVLMVLSPLLVGILAVLVVDMYRQTLSTEGTTSQGGEVSNLVDYLSSQYSTESENLAESSLSQPLYEIIEEVPLESSSSSTSQQLDGGMLTLLFAIQLAFRRTFLGIAF